MWFADNPLQTVTVKQKQQTRQCPFHFPKGSDCVDRRHCIGSLLRTWVYCHAAVTPNVSLLKGSDPARGQMTLHYGGRDRCYGHERSHAAVTPNDSLLKPVLKRANICFANIVRLFGVQKASLSMFWEYSPSSANIVSDWLRTKMTVSIHHSLRRNLTYLLTCRRLGLVSGIQNDIVVSWFTLWGMMKVYWLDLTWLDLTLAYIFDHAVCCASAASSGRSLHLIISQLRTKHSSWNCPNHVRRTKSSVKKRIIVRRTVRSMFGEQTVRPIKNGLNPERVGEHTVRTFRTKNSNNQIHVTVCCSSMIFTYY